MSRVVQAPASPPAPHGEASRSHSHGETYLVVHPDLFCRCCLFGASKFRKDMDQNGSSWYTSFVQSLSCTALRKRPSSITPPRLALQHAAESGSESGESGPLDLVLLRQRSQELDLEIENLRQSLDGRAPATEEAGTPGSDSVGSTRQAMSNAWQGFRRLTGSYETPQLSLPAPQQLRPLWILPLTQHFVRRTLGFSLRTPRPWAP